MIAQPQSINSWFIELIITYLVVNKENCSEIYSHLQGLFSVHLNKMHFLVLAEFLIKQFKQTWNSDVLEAILSISSLENVIPELIDLGILEAILEGLKGGFSFYVMTQCLALLEAIFAFSVNNFSEKWKFIFEFE